MNDYQVSDYQIFSNAQTTTKNYNTKVEDVHTSANDAKTIIGNTSVFMGPIQENCMTEFGTLETALSGITANFSTMMSYLGEVSNAYQTGDSNAAATVIGNNSSGTTSVNSQAALSSGAMTSYTFRNQNFNVVNTKISIQDYESYVQKAKIYQNAGVLGGDCMLLSQYYAKDMLSGKTSSKSTVINLQGSPATRINERMRSTDINDVLNYTYKELSEGHPVVLQVTQIHSDQGQRHLVTAVGYDSSVQSASDLTPDKILVLDCVDGKLQTLGQSRSEGGHARSLYAQGGNYQALGPTEQFLAKEVNGTATVNA